VHEENRETYYFLFTVHPSMAIVISGLSGVKLNQCFDSYVFKGCYVPSQVM